MNSADYTSFVDSRFKRMGSFPADMLHAAIGMVGEWGEFCQAITRENALEELGDFDFYLTQAKRLVVEQGVRFEEGLSFPMQIDQTLIALRNHSIEVLDLSKKMWVYNKEIPATRFRFNLEQLDHRVSHLAEFYAATRESLRVSNVDKLMKRYPAGYSDQAAQARADKPQGE